MTNCLASIYPFLLSACTFVLVKMTPLQAHLYLLPSLLVLMLLGYFAVVDASEQRVRNQEVYPFVFASVLFSLALNGGSVTLTYVFQVLPLVLFLYVFHVCAAGDIKLLVGLGVLIGMKMLIFVILLALEISAIVGAVAITKAIFSRKKQENVRLLEIHMPMVPSIFAAYLVISVCLMVLQP